MRYELIYLVGASEEANLEQIKKDIEKIISDFGGQWENDEWIEKKKLAYKIGKDIQGIYVAKRFNLLEKDNLTEINSQLRLFTQILRFMISRTENLPELNEEERKEKVEDKKTAEKKEIKKEEKKESSPSIEEKKLETKEKKVSEKSETGKEKKNSDEEIDKKLEEILNI